MENEEWRAVTGYEGFYEVSDLGRVRSLDRAVRSRGGFRLTRGCLLKPQKHSRGYAQVGLGRRTALVHRLVLDAFRGPCPDGMEGCHNNGVRTDNRLDNLRYDTPVSNAQDRRVHGTNGAGECNAKAKLTSEQVAEIRAARGVMRQRDLAARYGVGQTQISRIHTGQRW